MSLYAELQRRGVVRVAVAYLAASWLLIQVLETLFPVFDLPTSAIRIVVILLAILFLPTVVLSWVFELTPEGIRRDAAAASPAAKADKDHRLLDRIIMVTLILAVAFFAVDKFVLEPARDRLKLEAAAEKAAHDALIGAIGDYSLAVLPFDNLGRDPEQEYLSDGIAVALLDMLAKVEQLRVTPRSSAFAFRGRDVDVTEIAEKLNVRYILEGSLRKSANRIRISAQLVDAQTGFPLWSETFESEWGDIFAIEDEISANIVEQLKIELLGELPTAEQIDLQAYNLYLRGAHIVHSGQWDKLALAEELLQQALEAEPAYVPALSQLGRVYLSLPAGEGRSRDELTRLVRDVAARITAVAPGSADDLAWQAWITHQFDYDLEAAASLYQRALMLEPRNLDILRPATALMIELGLTDDALATAKYIVLRDPSCVNCLNLLSWAHRAAGEYDDAVRVLREAIEWSPERHLIHWSLGAALLQAGRPAEALDAFEKEKVVGSRNIGRAMALYDLGETRQFEREFAALRSDPSNSREAIARVAAWTGHNDLALQSLERMVEQDGPQSLTGVLSGGFYERLMTDPRFEALLRKYHQHPDQREKVDLKVDLPG